MWEIFQDAEIEHSEVEIQTTNWADWQAPMTTSFTQLLEVNETLSHDPAETSEYFFHVVLYFSSCMIEDQFYFALFVVFKSW